MKLKTWARLLLAVAPVLAGCKGFWDVQSGSGGGTGTASGIFYVFNQKTSEIAGFSIAAGATSLTAVTKSPYALSAAPLSAAISTNGGFLYVGTAGGVFAYSVDATTGELTILNSGNNISSDQATAMAIDASGGWLITAFSTLAGNDQVNAIPLDQTTGINLTNGIEQTTLQALPAGARVQQIVTTHSGAANPYVFVAMGGSGTAAIPFTASTSGNPFGTAKAYAVKNTAGGDNTLAVDASGVVLYVGETAAITGSNSGGVRMFTIGANATPLTELTGSPFASGGIGPSAILPTASYVYVANRSVSASKNGNIKAFAITSTAGTPTALTDVASGTIVAGVATVGLTEDSNGTYILAVNNSGAPDLNAYTISSTTGALTSYATGATGTDPVQAIAILAHK